MDRNDRRLAKQILLVLGYTDQFAYPLRRNEIKERLLAGVLALPVSWNQFNAVLSTIKKRGIVRQSNSFFSLPSSRISALELSHQRREKKKNAKKKRHEAEELIVFLKKIPLISGVLITGSVAMDNATQNDDVDFLIITKPGSLWVVRPIVVAYAWLKHKRRSWKKEEKNSWCFNFWLEETQLGLPKSKRTIYTAYELLQAEWVIAEPTVFRQYYSTNLWVKDVLPTFFDSARTPKEGVIKDTETLEKHEAWYLFCMYPVGWLNFVLYWAQRAYMYPHKTSERVGKSFAFFHPRDTHSQIFENWKTSLKRLVY